MDETQVYSWAIEMLNCIEESNPMVRLDVCTYHWIGFTMVMSSRSTHRCACIHDGPWHGDKQTINDFIFDHLSYLLYRQIQTYPIAIGQSYQSGDGWFTLKRDFWLRSGIERKVGESKSHIHARCQQAACMRSLVSRCWTWLDTDTRLCLADR